MTNNLYEAFGCQNKEELYEKMKEGVDEVRPLLEFFEYSKMTLKTKEEKISSPGEARKVLEQMTRPTKDSARVIFVNTQNRPIHICKMRLSQKKDIRRALSEGLNMGAAKMFLAVHENSNLRKIEAFEDIGDELNLGVLDRFTLNGASNKYHSKGNYSDYSMDSEVQILKESKHSTEVTFQHTEKFDEFAEYFARQELKGLNIISDREQIMEQMKLGFQFKQQEVFGYLSYDAKKNIKNMNILFKGGVDMTVADHRIILKELLKESNLKGFIIFHNHPSGVPTPSTQDINLTNRIGDWSQMLDIEFADHYIVGKEKVLSFVKETDPSMFSNHEYIDEMYTVKEMDIEYGEKKESEVQNMSVHKDVKTVLDELMEQDYESFIKALISTEKGITDEKTLDAMYESYMESDVNLLNDFFDDIEFDLQQGETLDNLVSADLLREKISEEKSIDTPKEEEIKKDIKSKSKDSLLKRLEKREDKGIRNRGKDKLKQTKGNQMSNEI
ncbi:MAG: JAB domain-containing protein [Tissierellia bacterium]|nr:JAB domain-containing protein [Tissierellia bacterium]